MDFIAILFIVGICIFILVFVFLFIKRLNDNKHTLNNINNEENENLKKAFEEELKQKKENELKKLKAGDRNTIIEVIERIFKSSKFAGWVKSKNIQLYDPKKLSLIIYFSEKEDLISTTKEITLKTGEVYKQNKHYLAIQKEYFEKVFQSAYKSIEEVFYNVPTIYKIYFSEYTKHNFEENFICTISFEVSRDQFNSVKDKNISFIEKLDYFKANYKYDSKDYVFEEIKPIDTPSGEISLEKTFAQKATDSTVFIGNTILSSDDEAGINLKSDEIQKQTVISNNTKISDLAGGSLMIDRTMIDINIDLPEEVKPENKLEKFFKLKSLKLISEETLKNQEISYFTENELSEKFLVHFSEDLSSIKEQSIRQLLGKMISENIEKGIFITLGTFSLEAVNFASKNNIEIFDGDMLKKLGII